MKILQIVASIYLGIFLILPGCLCQVLAPFGIIIHDHDHDVPSEICMEGASDSVPPCHCEHLDEKHADLLLEFDFEPELEGVFVEFSTVDFLLRFRSDKGNDAVHSRAGPPPPYIPSPVLTGKFLI